MRCAGSECQRRLEGGKGHRPRPALWLTSAAGAVQVAAGAVLGVVVGYLVGVSWSHPLPTLVP